MTIPLGPAAVQRLWPARPLSADRWSRSLWFERFANPALKDEKEDTPRRDFLEQGCNLRPTHQKPRAWLHFLRDEMRVEWDQILFAQVQSRLLLNAAGGVMENAGLALDRLSGQPFIPGSAVKGCARRMAIEELLSLRQRLFPSPSDCETPAELDAQPLPAVAERVSQLADSVVTFFKVFGWADVDWQSRREFRPPKRRTGERLPDYRERRKKAWCEKRPDVAWACGDARWLQVRRQVALRLAAWLRLTISAQKPLWKAAPNFAGLARFLPAYPVNVNLMEANLPTPDVGKLQLDVLAAHHREYHRDTPGYEHAPDTEDPNLVFFPTIAAGHVFALTVLGLEAQLVESGREWLKRGLEVFGLGAKTGAGYGWFLDVSPITAWLLRAEGFPGLTESDKELTVLDLAADAKLIPELEIQARKMTRELRDYFQQRAAFLVEPTLSVLNKTRGFTSLGAAEQNTAGLGLIDHFETMSRAEQHFPHLLGPVLAFLC